MELGRQEAAVFQERGLFVLPAPWEQYLGNLAHSTKDQPGDTQALEKVLRARDLWGRNELGLKVSKKG